VTFEGGGNSDASQLTRLVAHIFGPGYDLRVNKFRQWVYEHKIFSTRLRSLQALCPPQLQALRDSVIRISAKTDDFFVAHVPHFHQILYIQLYFSKLAVQKRKEKRKT